MNDPKTRLEARYLEQKRVLSEAPENVFAVKEFAETCVKLAILSVDSEISKAYIDEADAATMLVSGKVKKESKECFLKTKAMISNGRQIFQLREDRANKLKYAQLAKEYGKNMLRHYLALKSLQRSCPENINILKEYVDCCLALASQETNIVQRWTYIMNAHDAQDLFGEEKSRSDETLKIAEEIKRRISMAKQAVLKEERRQIYAEHAETLSRQYEESKGMLGKAPCNVEALKQFVESSIWLGLNQKNRDKKWIYLLEAYAAWNSCSEANLKNGDYSTEIADIYELLDAVVEDEIYV